MDWEREERVCVKNKVQTTFPKKLVHFLKSAITTIRDASFSISGS